MNLSHRKVKQTKTHGKSCRMVSGSQNNKFSIQLSASQIFNSTQISKWGETPTLN